MVDAARVAILQSVDELTKDMFDESIASKVYVLLGDHTEEIALGEVEHKEYAAALFEDTMESDDTWVGRCRSVQLELSTLEHALPVVETNLDDALDGKRLGSLRVLVYATSLVTNAVRARAQDTMQEQASVIDRLAKEVWHERRFGRHLE